MKLIPAPDGENLFCRLVSEDGKVEMGVGVVMFGYRVYAGYVDGGMYSLDWCGGSIQLQVEHLYSTCKAILELRPSDNPGAFLDMPGHSDIKPYFNDDKFLSRIIKLAPEAIEHVDLPTLSTLRTKFLSTIAESHATILKLVNGW